MEGAARLDAALRAGHDAGDPAALIALYTRAAETRPEAAAFFLTHAWIFALEAGDARAARLEARLRAAGRA